MAVYLVPVAVLAMFATFMGALGYGQWVTRKL